MLATIGGGSSFIHRVVCLYSMCSCFIIFIDKHFICIIQEISHIATNSSVKLTRLVKHINCFSMTLGLVHRPVLAFHCVHASFLVLEQLSPLILCGPSFISDKLLGCSVCYTPNLHVCTIVLLNEFIYSSRRLAYNNGYK